MEIVARNTNTLAPLVYRQLVKQGLRQTSRNGPVLMFPEPVSIRITNPEERVNFCPVRDANPYFHLMEALAMLADRNSVDLLAYFARSIAQFSDDGLGFNAFYGERALYTWGNQISAVIDELTAKPDSRQCVVQLWNPLDLTRTTKDKACNLCMLFSVVLGELRMTTFNRSNDAVLGGVSGANIVHLSLFQEYVACALGLAIGPWWHVSNNLHVYIEQTQWLKLENQNFPDGDELYSTFRDPLVPLWDKPKDRVMFDAGLATFFSQVMDGICREKFELLHSSFYNRFLSTVALPMWNSWQMHKAKEHQAALHHAQAIASPDWRTACVRWLERRAK